MSVSSIQEEWLSTPMRAQRCLFGSGKSSSKKSAHSSGKKKRKENDSEDSDIGPMSPLTFSDQSPSSCESSPRYCYSPLDKSKMLSSPLSTHVSWDRLTSRSSKHCVQDSPITLFRRITMPAKESPCRKLVLDSSKSSPKSTEKNILSPRTPEASDMTIISDEIIPETPPRNFGKEIQNGIAETPSKYNSTEYRHITPMSTESKVMSMPRLHKRKSIFLDTIENSSPDRNKSVLKRHAHEPVSHHGSKLLRTDENTSIPKARAALFQEKTSESKLKQLTLSTKSFYSSNTEKKENLEKFDIRRDLDEKKHRRSLPAMGYHAKKIAKRISFGAINGGVSHGVKRRKPKPTPERVKKNSPNHRKSLEKNKQVSPINANETNSPVIPMKRPPSPEIDPNKRFFKSKRSVKLQYTDSPIVLTKKYAQAGRQANKKQKLDISFDTTELTVDEPEMDASVQQCKLDNILKVLEDDWADDDYDNLETLTNQPVVSASPARHLTLSNDMLMSPSSELSNLTSTMNIDDVALTTSEKSTNNNTTTDDTTVEQKFFPLFAKGYTPKDPTDNKTTKSPNSGRKGLNWQLSIKEGDGEKQSQLDVGQKRFGAVQCPECKIVYQVGEPEDETAHLNYHNSKLTLKFPGWKTERAIFTDSVTQSRIILIEPNDSKQCWTKVTSILTVVDRDLGLVDAKLSEYQNKKVYLYIRDKTVLGVLVAEPIKTAHRMIPELLELDCCTAESTPAKCGVNVIWTAMSHRKQGIATKLMDMLRAQFYYGYIMSMEDIAFSIPTPSGKKFAEKYTKTRNFKVYS